MTVKANWGLQALSGPSSGETATIDPFESASCSSMKAGLDRPDWAMPVGLGTPIDELERLLAQNIGVEDRLRGRGLTCSLRDSGAVSCLTCPLSAAGTPSDEKAHLCRVGCNQEILRTTLLAKRQVNAPDDPNDEFAHRPPQRAQMSFASRGV